MASVCFPLLPENFSLLDLWDVFIFSCELSFILKVCKKILQFILSLDVLIKPHSVSTHCSQCLLTRILRLLWNQPNYSGLQPLSNVFCKAVLFCKQTCQLPSKSSDCSTMTWSVQHTGWTEFPHCYHFWGKRST